MDFEKERVYAETERAAQDRPFAGHDARLSAGANAARTTLGGSTKTTQHRAPLEDVSDRVQRLGTFAVRITENLVEIGHKMRTHADLVYGEAMAQDTAEALRQQILDPCPPFGGALGEVHNQLHGVEEVLHRLDQTLSYVAYQAGRNTTLA